MTAGGMGVGALSSQLMGSTATQFTPASSLVASLCFACVVLPVPSFTAHCLDGLSLLLSPGSVAVVDHSPLLWTSCAVSQHFQDLSSYWQPDSNRGSGPRNDGQSRGQSTYKRDSGAPEDAAKDSRKRGSGSMDEERGMQTIRTLGGFMR